MSSDVSNQGDDGLARVRQCVNQLNHWYGSVSSRTEHERISTELVAEVDAAPLMELALWIVRNENDWKPAYNDLLGRLARSHHAATILTLQEDLSAKLLKLCNDHFIQLPDKLSQALAKLIETERLTTYQTCSDVIPGIPFFVTYSDKALVSCLLDQIRNRHASQILVTGRQSWWLFHESTAQIKEAMGEAWHLLGSHEAPCRETQQSLLHGFVQSINSDATGRHMCFCPIDPASVRTCFAALKQPGSMALYVVGLTGTRPRETMLAFRDAILPWQTDASRTSVTCVVSAEDHGILIKTQQAISDDLSRRRPVDRLLCDAILLLERMSVPPAEKRKGPFLDSPDVRLSYKCECGRFLSVGLKSFNVVGGTEAMCSHCGAVLFLPPDILDHQTYWPEFQGAMLKQNWQDIAKLVRHGKAAPDDKR